MRNDLPSLEKNLKSMTPSVEGAWSRLRGAVDGKNASDKREAQRPLVDNGEAAVATQNRPQGPPNRYKARGQRSPGISSDSRIPWHQILGNALSVGRDICFSSCEEARWDVDDYDNSDRPVAVDGS